MTENEDNDYDVLPVEAYRDELMRHIAENQIIICQGETGSGKTTKIPQFFLEAAHLLSGAKMIAVTQPRRIAAITVAQRVAEERNSRLGDEVGYCVRFDDNTSSTTRAKFMTDGILVRECLSDPLLSKYQAVMLDEAHERSIHTDILFGLVKKACQSRPDLKVVVTSATLNEEKFSHYFNNCPILNIPGRLFHVDLYHSKVRQVMTVSGPSNSSYVDTCVQTVLKIHGSQEKGHILVFLTGSDEIERACSSLRRQLDDMRADAREYRGEREYEHESESNELVVVPLYASLSPQEQRKAFVSCGHRRKCVIATNIAETSVTVPGIRFVVDPGYVKQKCYDPSRRIESLLVVPISKVSAQQRAGRAGRTGPGQCFRLYSSDCYTSFAPETIPEMLRCNLANTLLYLKVLGIDDVMGFEFMDPPSPQQLSEGLVVLHLLGALDDRGQVTSPVGRGMALYPLDPPLSRMLVEAARPENDCLDEVSIIAAMLSVEEIFHYPKRSSVRRGGESYRPQQQEEEATAAVTQAHDLLRHSLGDHFTYLKIFKKYEAEGGNYDWCERHFIKFRAMKTATKIRSQLMNEASNVAALHGSDSSSRARSDERGGGSRSVKDVERAIQRSLAAGLFMNSGRKCANGLAYHSVPLDIRERDWADGDFDFVAASSTAGAGAGAGAGATGGGGGEGGGVGVGAHLRDMLQGVKLMHLHPTASLGGSSGNTAPACLVYQDLLYTGRIMMRHVSTVDEATVQRFRQKWVFVHPLLLSGRTAQKKKRKIAATNSDQAVAGGGASTSTSTTSTNSGCADVAVASKADDAKARYLKRKLEKQGGR